jgi:hypothetical protein
MSNLKEQIEALKEQRIQEIITNNNLTKLEKLKIFNEESLFNIESFIQDDEIFEEWVNELILKVKEETKRDWVIIDTFISPSECDLDKYSTFYLFEIESLLENLIEDNDEDYEGKVFDYPNTLPIVTARSSELTINKTPQEVLDKIYTYAITNKVCGYKIDW